MSIRTRKNVGVIGLGIIGQRVAENLRERGFHVFVWNRTPRAVPNFVGSPAEVAELCDVIQIFVSDDEALLQTVQRITRDLTPNHVVMAHCTVSPDTMRAAAEIVEKRGARFLDAPFTGSKIAAEKGQLVYYVGGDETALRQARPVLEASSKEILEVGKVGDATTIKVATNMVTAASVQAAAEALALIAKSGLSVESFANAMRNNGSNSSTLDMKLPMMMEGNFEPHFSVKHMLKDVVIATRLARAFGMEFGATDASRHGLTEEMRQGRGDDDYSSLFRQYFPAGRSLKNDGQVLNGEDDQPRFAALEEVKGAAQVAEPIVVEANAPATTEAKIESEPTIVTLAPDETDEGALRMAAAQSMTTVAESDAQPTVAPEPADKEVQSEEPRGMWGGFWRRRTDD
jgi:3-hydroxyisobutyrate dehydrogenase-like beta-hydroxyacid dehydrogenase